MIEASGPCRSCDTVDDADAAVFNQLRRHE